MNNLWQLYIQFQDLINKKFRQIDVSHLIINQFMIGIWFIYQNIQLRMDFKKFINNKINYLSSHFRKSAILLQENGQALSEINLSFDSLSDQFMLKSQQMETSKWQKQHSTIKMESISQDFIKITDEQLLPLWQHLDNSYKLSFNVDNQNIGDETLLKLSELYVQGKCSFSKLTLSNNNKITQIGATSLSKSLQLTNNCSNIKCLEFHNLTLGIHGANRIIELIVCCKNLSNLDLGVIGNSSLKYLAEILKNSHGLESIGFGQDQNEQWKDDGLKSFQQVIRRNQNSKQIFSINLYPSKIVKYWDLINQLNILCQKRRIIRVHETQNSFKAAALNPDHDKYYDSENHGQNAYKFSVKSYLTNVFGSDLDQALYFLEKQRRNSLREESIFQITRQPINKLILQDICTADGSILVLAKYLLGKIGDKKI